MSYQFKDLKISKLSIIGAGQIGPDIALHFAKVFATHDVQIVIVDIAEKALDNAKKKIEKKIAKGLETRAFKPEMAEAMSASIHYTLYYENIANSDIVLEAATEDENIKDVIFKQVQEICDENCLFFSNSSHMQPEVIFKNIKDQSRCMVTHYFFPAERNPVIEIIPSGKTAPAHIDNVMGLYESIGKIPIKVKSSYGYAVDPIFEGLCQTAILCLERGYGSVKEIDKAACDTLGLGVGPFTALNLTGGNPITNHGLDEMGEKLMPWFRSPDALQKAVADGTPWPTAGRNEVVEVPDDKRAKLENEFLGAYFALSGFILDLGIVDVSDLNLACEIALSMKAPFKMMNKIGTDKALEIVTQFCGEHTGFDVPISLANAAQTGNWKIHNVIRTVKNNIAVLTIRRPKVLNALNSELMAELKDHFDDISKDSSIIGSVLTGFGNKAFVSGADIRELASCKTPEEGYQMCMKFHDTLNFIDQMNKPVVCAMNGFAFGGGNELAMACSTRICKKGLPIAVCQPEVNLGFIPGSGGTQRLPRLVGLGTGSEILRTGRPVSSEEAVRIGLILKEVEGDLIDEGINVIKQLYRGSISPRKASEIPLYVIGERQNIVIGHLSKKIDHILSKAIYEGAKMDFKDGLELEARLFGECINTKDMKIGLENFMKNGPKVKAEFVHE